MNIDVTILLKNFCNHDVRNETIVLCEYLQQCIKTCSEETDLFETYLPIRELFKNDKKRFINFVNDIIGNANYQCLPFISKCNFVEKRLIEMIKKEPNIIPTEDKIFVNNPLDLMSITTSAPTTLSNFSTCENASNPKEFRNIFDREQENNKRQYWNFKIQSPEEVKENYDTNQDLYQSDEKDVKNYNVFKDNGFGIKMQYDPEMQHNIEMQYNTEAQCNPTFQLDQPHFINSYSYNEDDLYDDYENDDYCFNVINNLNNPNDSNNPNINYNQYNNFYPQNVSQQYFLDDNNKHSDNDSDESFIDYLLTPTF